MGHTAEDGAGADAWRRRARVAGLVVGVLVLLAIVAQSPPRERHQVFGADRTLNIAHGGAQAHAPGNTLAAFDLALELGADVLEMDAQLTADGVVVLHHDGTVDRQTDGRGAVADLTVDQLRRLDAGHGFTGPDGDHPWRGRGATIPTLDEVLARYPGTPLIIEMKLDGGPGIVDALADRLETAGRTDDVIVASFDLDLLRALRRRLPEVATNLPEDETRAFYTRQLVGLDRWWQAPAGFLQVPEYHDGRHIVTDRFVRAADRRGVDVHVWTVNDEADMRRLVGLGVHGIMTDRPDRLARVLDDLTPETAGPTADDPVQVTRWMQEHLDPLTPLMQAVTALGDEDFYLVVFPLLYWSVSRRIGIRVGVMLLLSAGLNAVLKLGSGSPRPLFLAPEVGLVQEETFGIPSGHAQNAVAVWGTLAAEIARRWAWVVAVALMLLLGVSRIHLGAHFPVDTVTGWGVGVVLLAAYLRWGEPVAAWSRRAPIGRVVLVTLAVSLGLIAAGTVAAAGYAGWSPPTGWDGPGEAATGLSDVVTPAAALTGLVLGLAVLWRRGGFEVAGAVWRRLLRYPVGLVGVLLLWQGLGAVLPDGESVLALTGRYLRYALVGSWIAGGAPVLFVALGLARPAVDRAPPTLTAPTARATGSEPEATGPDVPGETTEDQHADG